MPYRSEKLQWRGDFYRANGRWPSTAEMHSAFDEGVPETSPGVPGNVPGDSTEEGEGTLPGEDVQGERERSPTLPKARWNICTGFL